MNIHKNSRLTPVRREEIALAVVAGQLTRAQAARLCGVSSKIVAPWAGHYKTGGRNAMTDRSSRPKRIPAQTDDVLAERNIALRRQRLTGSHIAIETGVSAATVSNFSQTRRSVTGEGPCARRAGDTL